MSVLRLLRRPIWTTDLVSPRLDARLKFTPHHRRPRPVHDDISELTFTIDGRPL